MIVAKGDITEFKDIKQWYELSHELAWIIDNAIDFVEENKIGFDDGEDFIKVLIDEIDTISSDRGYKKRVSYYY